MVQPVYVNGDIVGIRCSPTPTSPARSSTSAASRLPQLVGRLVVLLQDGSRKPQLSHKIDTKLSAPLFKLPIGVDTGRHALRS
jgi:hypothetical protein